MSRLRVGCVGTGFIAGRHLAALASFPDVEVVAVADPADGRAREAADRYGARAYEDGLDLLAHEELDAVWLCVPPFAHGALEEAAIARRLPFFVEKPLATDLDTATAIAARVRETGLLTAVGYHWRHLDVVQQAADALAGRTVQLAVGHWLDGTPAAPWWARRDRSGGQVVEQTTHLFDLARVLVGEVEAVSAVEVTVPRARLPDADVPTASTTTLRFSSGALGTISSTCALAWRHRVGLHLVAEDVVVELLERGLGDHELRVRTPAGEQVLPSDQDPVAREDQEFLDVLRGVGSAVRVSYDEALRTHALAEAADRSARCGTPVRLAGAG
ncbi:Gfo/Idh/MocA family protein [Modestobacter sp. I12A-02662]|uniref:Gfo/Idh/MocA family protein n=1 Tax=Modestobacter sp. I12A-02662 TaxID=1730496 RepID=UPI0034DE098F